MNDQSEALVQRVNQGCLSLVTLREWKLLAKATGRLFPRVRERWAYGRSTRPGTSSTNSSSSAGLICSRWPSGRMAIRIIGSLSILRIA